MACRSQVADTWFRAIAGTSFTPRPLAEIRARLSELVDIAIDALFADPFPESAAVALGSALAELHYLDARALAGTLRALGLGLSSNLSPEESAELHPRLIDLLAAIAAGFYAAGRENILREQDEIRQALFVTRQQAEAADEARSVAEASARARSDLLSHVAHDLRSPLTSIRGQADLIVQRLNREVPSIDWLRARVAHIRGATDRMQGMIGELLDAARLQIGEQLELNLRSVDVVEVVRRAVEYVEATGRHIRLDLDSESIVANVDGARLERVLHNLLSNAVKYSPPQAPISILVRHGEDDLTIAISDQGFGIPAEELTRVTTPFYRASTARAIPGTGLGLAGVKAIVEQHGGRLVIDSVVGVGTTVTLRLPVRRES